MEEILKLQPPFQVGNIDFLKRRLLYGAAAIIYVLFLYLSARDCCLQGMTVLYENQGADVPAGKANPGRMPDTLGAAGTGTAAFPLKGTGMDGLGSFLAAEEISIQTVPSKPDTSISINTENPVVTDIKNSTVADIKNPVVTDIENPAVTDTENSGAADTENPPAAIPEDPGILDSENPAEEMVPGIEVQGFLLNPSGHIVSCSTGLDLTDGYLCLPWDAACTGIEAGALDGVQDMIFEIYVPANIVYIAPGAFDGLGNLFYIYAEPGNPVYASDEEGILYRKSDGVQIACPCGRG